LVFSNTLFSSQYGGNISFYQYVLINQGDRFRVVYSCKAEMNPPVGIRYLGDCADDGSAAVGDDRVVTPLYKVQDVFSTATSNLLLTPVSYGLPELQLFSTFGYGYHMWLPHPLIQDMNGDGMTDLVYSKNDSGEWKQFVMLGTGNGFRVGYFCRKRSHRTGTDYYGDCAQ
jgi:hypothetical protein